MARNAERPSERPSGTLHVRRVAGPEAPVRDGLFRRRPLAFYEVVAEDGSTQLLTRSELDRLVGAARVPADFWDLTHWADAAFEEGNETLFFTWPVSWPGVTLTSTAESFRQQGPWILSSRGFWVRALGRSGMEYAEAGSLLEVDAEAMATPAFVVYAASIPVADRARILDNLTRAWAWCGYRVDVPKEGHTG